MRTPRVGPTRVMVVDDNPIVRRVLAARLRRAGCSVSEAADGLAALEEFRRRPAEVVVTDLSMPRLDGLDLLAALRGLESAPEVVLLTGSRAGDAGAVVKALRLGAHDYIAKAPDALDAAALAVERAAAKRRSREEKARLVAELRRLSLRDELTGVGNRRAFDEALRQEIARARRADGRLALVMLDLDRFKAINDALGHPAADEILVGFATRLRLVTREGDRVFRYGGEEFALLVAGADAAAGLAVARRAVRATAGAPFAAGPRSVGVTCSAGVSALAPDDDPAGARLVARADAALYAAKGSGRNRAVAGEGALAGAGATTEAGEVRR